MELHTLQYTTKKGWSSDSFPALDSENTLILIFAAPEFREDLSPIKELAKRYPQSKIIGCSSAGEIAGSAILDKSLSVAFVRFNKTKIKICSTEIKSVKESETAGEALAKKLYTDNLRALFVLSEGLNVNGSDLVKGLNKIKDQEENKEEIVITGGLAGDGKDFKLTWTIFEGEIRTNQIVAVGFYGSSLHIGHASRGGWSIFGPERRVTKSHSNVLYELDNKPALALYKDYLGERARELPSSGLLYPLAIRQNQYSSKQLVRTILAVNEEEQTLTFAGDIPHGYLAQLMRANLENLISSASEAGDLAIKRMLNLEKDMKGPLLAIAISCVGRRLLLGERTEEEIESMVDILPKNTQQVGFYSYGELSPYTTGACDLHNQTMTITTFYEQ